MQAIQLKTREWVCKRTMLILFWMSYRRFLWRTKKNVFLIFFLFLFECFGGSCFFVELKYSLLNYLVSFRCIACDLLFLVCVCVYIYIYICVCVCVCVYIYMCVCIYILYSSLWKFILIWSDFSFLKNILTLKLMKWCLLFKLAKLSFRDNSRWALF